MSYSSEIGHVPLPIPSNSPPSNPPRRQRAKRQKLKLKITYNKSKRRKISQTVITQEKQPPQQPEPVPKPPSPKRRGPSKYETISNLDPSILSAIASNNQQFLKTLFKTEETETIIDGDGNEYTMKAKDFMDKVQDEMINAGDLDMDDDEVDDDADLQIMNDKMDDDEEDYDYKDMVIKDELDSKQKRWNNKNKEIDRLLYALNDALYVKALPNAGSREWWEGVKSIMKVTRNPSDIKGYVDRITGKAKVVMVFHYFVNLTEY